MVIITPLFPVIWLAKVIGKWGAYRSSSSFAVSLSGAAKRFSGPPCRPACTTCDPRIHARRAHLRASWPPFSRPTPESVRRIPIPQGNHGHSAHARGPLQPGRPPPNPPVPTSGFGQTGLDPGSMALNILGPLCQSSTAHGPRELPEVKEKKKGQRVYMSPGRQVGPRQVKLLVITGKH